MLWNEIFETFKRQAVSYVVLRDGGQLVPQQNQLEVDLLIAPNCLAAAAGILRGLGFIKLRRWGHSPHHFFLTYDKASDVWIKLDIVTEIACGRPVHALPTRLAANCLANRVLVGGVFVPAPEDELSALLMHCLLDKKAFEAHRMARLQGLSATISDHSRIEKDLAAASAGALHWPAVKPLIDAGDVAAIARLAPRVKRAIAGKYPLRVCVRNVLDRVLRKVSKIAAAISPETPSVALLAPDGAGKSTLARELAHHFFLPGETVYMGLYQREGGSIAGTLPGIAFGTRVVRQWTRCLKGRYRRSLGRLVIFDRYSYDALLPSRRSSKISQRLRRWCLANSCPNVDLVLLLDVPGEVLYARKKEHSSELLEQQRQAYLGLMSHVPGMVIVDANREADEVRRDVTDHIWRNCRQRREIAG